jgi:hypothetical protein
MFRPKTPLAAFFLTRGVELTGRVARRSAQAHQQRSRGRASEAFSDITVSRGASRPATGPASRAEADQRPPVRLWVGGALGCESKIAGRVAAGTSGVSGQRAQCADQDTVAARWAAARFGRVMPTFARTTRSADDPGSRSWKRALEQRVVPRAGAIAPDGTDGCRRLLRGHCKWRHRTDV